MKKLIAFILVALIAFAAVAWRWGFQPVPAEKVAGRVALLKQEVAREIPIGSKQKDIIEWAMGRGRALHLRGHKDLYGVIDTLEGGGINFPCSRWYIILEITMEDKTSKKQTVRAADGCK